MQLLQLISVLIPLAIMDSINPSAIILTTLMLTKGVKIKNILFYILGILVSYYLIGAVALIIYNYLGTGYKLDFSFINQYFNSPPFWLVILELIAGLAIMIQAIYNKSHTQKKEISTKKKHITQTTLMSFFGLGVVVTGVEAVSALPYFGALSVMFLAQVSLLTNLILLLIYCILFVLPPLLLIGLRLIYNDHFEKVLTTLKKISAKYSSILVLYGSLFIGVLLVVDALHLLVR